MMQGPGNEYRHIAASRSGRIARPGEGYQPHPALISGTHHGLALEGA